MRWPQWFLMLVEMEDGQSCIGLACFREPSSIGQFGLIRATPTMKSIGDGYLQKHLEAMYSLRLSSWFGVITDICMDTEEDQAVSAWHSIHYMYLFQYIPLAYSFLRSLCRTAGIHTAYSSIYSIITTALHRTCTRCPSHTLSKSEAFSLHQ